MNQMDHREPQSQDPDPAFHPFPLLLPYELRCKIWLLSFPPRSHRPLIRISVSPSTKGTNDPGITYACKLSTDTIRQARTSPEYLQARTFLTICYESKELYIKTFNLTHLLPPSILYDPASTTVFFENGLLPTTDGQYTGFPSLKHAPFVQNFQKLALPLPATNSTIRHHPQRASNLDALWFNPPPRPDTHDYSVNTMAMLGWLFCQLTDLRQVYIILRDEVAPVGDPVRLSDMVDTQDTDASLMELLEFFKVEFYHDAVASGRVRAGWDVPTFTVVNEWTEEEEEGGEFRL